GHEGEAGREARDRARVRRRAPEGGGRADLLRGRARDALARARRGPGGRRPRELHRLLFLREGPGSAPAKGAGPGREVMPGHWSRVSVSRIFCTTSARWDMTGSFRAASRAGSAGFAAGPILPSASAARMRTVPDGSPRTLSARSAT